MIRDRRRVTNTWMRLKSSVSVRVGVRKTTFTIASHSQLHCIDTIKERKVVDLRLEVAKQILLFTIDV